MREIVVISDCRHFNRNHVEQDVMALFETFFIYEHKSRRKHDEQDGSKIVKHSDS